MDREKVIKGLHQHCEGSLFDRCGECPYYVISDEQFSCRDRLLDDAIALLKEPMHSPLYKVSEIKVNKDGTGSVTYTLKGKDEQMFTVIDSKTGKEADIEEIALHEEWAKSLVYCDMEGWALQDDGQLILMDECGNYEYADRERFKVIWDA